MKFKVNDGRPFYKQIVSGVFLTAMLIIYTYLVAFASLAIFAIAYGLYLFAIGFSASMVFNIFMLVCLAIVLFVILVAAYVWAMEL